MKKQNITSEEKLNYIRHFICRNLKKINMVKKIFPFELDPEYESEEEFITDTELEDE